MRIAVIGAGAWGSALATALADTHEVELWARDPAQRERLRVARESSYLVGVRLADGVAIATQFEAAVCRAELVLVVTPSAGLRATLEALVRHVPATPVVWACKGLEEGADLLAHEVAAQVLSAEVPRGVLSGPSFALEVARGLPAALTLASPQEEFARSIARALHQRRLRVYWSTDVAGVEIGGAVKNVMAIATGIADGLRLGLNARAALITRGLAEITRLGLARGGRLETFMGLTGVGDLILTCTGDLSRNRTVGLALAEGRRLEEILVSLGHVAEGVRTARSVARSAARLGIEMPITQAVVGVLEGTQSPREAVERLLARDPRDEAP